MIKTITARYPGKCARTGAPIKPGDPIKYDTATRRAWIDHADTITPAAALALDIDPELDRETAESVGAYMAHAARGYRSDIYRANGREYYRNKAGRCEDAPCCGCCNF
jgi:hypothetical protein